MNRIIFALMSVLLSLSAQADSRLELVGCWESVLKELEGNTATFCLNYEIASIAYLFTNKENDSTPTRCFQHAFIKSEEKSILLEGVGGFCDNGRKQGALAFRCWPTKNNKMPCEMFFEHTKLDVTKVEKK